MTTFADGENGLSVRTKINDVLQHMDGTAGTLVVNEAGADVDFRVESDTVINALFVDGATGNVGLGTGTPAAELHVRATSDPEIRIDNGTALSQSRFSFYTSSALEGYVGLTANSGILNIESGRSPAWGGSIAFTTDTAERMRITSAGNVGIGTLTPSVKLDVVGAGDGSLQWRTSTRTIGIGTISGLSSLYAGSGTEIMFHIGGEHMRLTSTGNLGIGTSTPGARLSTSQVVSAQLTSSVILNGNYAAGNLSHGVGFSINSAPVSAGLYATEGGGAGTNLVFATAVSTATPTLVERMRIDSTGNVGIGINAPTAALDVTGSFRLPVRALRLGDYGEIIRLGRSGVDELASIFYPAPGVFAINTSSVERMRVDAIGNVGLGAGTITGIFGRTLQIGDGTQNSSISLIGQGAGTLGDMYIATFSNVASIVARSGTPLTFSANDAPEQMRLDTSGRVLIGTTTASGANLLQVNSDALVNAITVGRGAGGALTNAAFGVSALVSNTTGVSNTAVGSYALVANTTGGAITAVGNQAAVSNTIGVNLTAIGYNALFANTIGNNNTAVGQAALFGNIGGSSNIGIGRDAGSALTTGSNNTIIGSVAGTAGLADTVILGAGTTERMRIDSSGNMGLGVTPSAWSGLGVTSAVIQTPSAAIVSPPGGGVNTTSLVTNAFYNGTNWIYRSSQSAARYDQWGSEHRWFGAPSGTLGGTVTFTQSMTLDVNGRLGIGTTTPAARLDVQATFADSAIEEIVRIDRQGGTSAYSFDRAAAIAFRDGLNSTLTGAVAGIRPSAANNFNGSLGFYVATGGGSPTTSVSSLTEAMRISQAGNLGVGTNAPNAASIIDAQSTTKGVRFPNMTTTQKNAIANVAGNVVFDTTLGKLCVNTGSGWQTITSA